MRIILLLVLIFFFHCATVFTPAKTTIFIKSSIGSNVYELFCDNEFIGKSDSSAIFVVSQSQKCKVQYYINQKVRSFEIQKRWNPLYFSGISFMWTSFSTDYFTGYHKIQPEEFVLKDD